jgi:stage II sporulation protein GA (sporulation sigma-E factor processing peptidase)
LQVYLDGVLVLNFLVDYLLILGTNRLTGYPGGIGKGLIAAFIGGMYGALCLIPGFGFLGNLLWRIVFLMLIAVTAFGLNRSTFHRGAVFVLLTMALGGIASGAGARDIGGVCICGLLLWLLCRAGFPSVQGRKYQEVELHHEGRSVNLLALVDTGNTLRDPLTGEQVFVCGADVGEELLGVKRNCFADPVRTVAAGAIYGARLLPYHAIGQPGGVLLVLRLRGARVGGREIDPLVAFAPQEIAKGEAYRMLTGGI